MTCQFVKRELTQEGDETARQIPSNLYEGWPRRWRSAVAIHAKNQLFVDAFASNVRPDGEGFVSTPVRILLLSCIAVLMGGRGVWAQAPGGNGVVWTPPAPQEAAADLRQMRAMGIDAVRTPVISDERLLTAADTLGIKLYQELPIAFLSAPALNDSVEAAARILQQVLQRAQARSGVQHIGLARYVDTSDPAACAYFDRLAAQIPDEAPVRTYYVTSFAAADRCAASVDWVLLDTRGADDPRQRLRRWTAAHADEARVGLGALGTWVDPAGPRGLQHPHSPERQARYLEEHLQHAASDSASVATRFVYRWRDADTDPYGRHFGLYAEDGTARPAAEVVRGIYTGQQSVFAFSAGTSPAAPFPWHMIVGWGIVALLGIVYAREPLFRQTLARYFRAHVFYQEVIREGRDMLVGSSLTLLAGEAISIGLLFFVGAEQVRYLPEVVQALRAVPEPLQNAIAPLLDAPGTFGLLAGVSYALMLLVWALGLVFAARRHDGLTPEQALMLVAWPRWPLLLLMAGPLVASTLAPPVARAVLMGVVASGMLLAPWMAGRTLTDYRAVARVPRAAALATALLSPIVPLLLVVLVQLLRYDVPLRLIWHLLTRS